METMHRGTPGLWLGRIGACLSMLLLGVSLLGLAEVHPATCTRQAGATGSIDMAPVLFFLVAALTLGLDVRAVRRGGATGLWGRIGLTAISSAAVFGIWAAAEGILRAGGCGG